MRPNAFVSVAGFSLVWIVLSVLTPGTTFHLGPVIVAAVPAIRARSAPGRHAAAGTLLAMTVAIGLAAAGYLEGPSLLPFGGALAESVVAAAAGGLAGFLLVGRLGGTVSDDRH